MTANVIIGTTHGGTGQAAKIPPVKFYSAIAGTAVYFPANNSTGVIRYTPSNALLAVLRDSSITGTISFLYTGQFTMGSNGGLPIRFTIGTNVSSDLYTPPYATIISMPPSGGTISSVFVIENLSLLASNRASITRLELYVKNENTQNLEISSVLPQNITVTISPQMVDA